LWSRGYRVERQACFEEIQVLFAMCGPSDYASVVGTSTAWQNCRMNSTFLECYAEASTTESRPRSRSEPPPPRTRAIPNSTLALQQAYAQSLAERAEGMAKSANDWKDFQRPSSAPAKLGYGKPYHELASSGRSHRLQNHFQDAQTSWEMEKGNVECNMLIDQASTAPSDQAFNDEGSNYNEYADNISSEMTTVMLCNIPCRVTLEEIIHAVRSLGFDDTYDLLHAPGPKRRHRYLASTTNIGYAFINFVKPEDAQNFMKAFEGFCFEGRHSEKVGMAKFGRVQGFHNNYMLMKGSIAPCVLPMGAPRDCIELKRSQPQLLGRRDRERALRESCFKAITP